MVIQIYIHGLPLVPQDRKDLTPVRGQDRKKSQTPKGKISGLQRGFAGLETNRNLSASV